MRVVLNQENKKYVPRNWIRTVNGWRFIEVKQTDQGIWVIKNKRVKV